jgi:hypothetical protein
MGLIDATHITKLVPSKLISLPQKETSHDLILLVLYVTSQSTPLRRRKALAFNKHHLACLESNLQLLHWKVHRPPHDLKGRPGRPPYICFPGIRILGEYWWEVLNNHKVLISGVFIEEFTATKCWNKLNWKENVEAFSIFFVILVGRMRRIMLHFILIYRYRGVCFK